MLDLTGDILNWLAAGVVFPLMLVPLAALASNNRATATGVWFLIVAVLVCAGAYFAYRAPILNLAPTATQALTFAALSADAGVLLFAAGGPARFSAAISPALSGVTRAAGRVVMWFVIAMAFVQFAVVVLRYVFGVNFIFMQESITYMHGAVFLLAGGYALLTDDHVRVDIFYRGASEKRKALIDFLGTYLFLFPICLLLFWSASPYVANSWAVGEGSQETSGIQGVYILKSFIPAFALLLSMAGFVIAARAAETLKGRG